MVEEREENGYVTDPQDPIAQARATLGIGPKAAASEIRAAYLGKLRSYPPDRAPEEFQRISAAYELLRDPQTQLRQILGGVTRGQELSDWVRSQPGPRRFVGTGPWLHVLEKDKRRA